MRDPVFYLEACGVAKQRYRGGMRMIIFGAEMLAVWRCWHRTAHRIVS